MLRAYSCRSSRDCWKRYAKLRIRDVPKNEVTDDHIELFLKTLLKPKDIVYDFDRIVGEELIYHMSIPDGDARLMKLFMEFDDIIQKHALSDVFEDDAGRKLKANLLVKALKPETVRRMAATALKFKFGDARNTDRELFDVLLRIVINQEEIHQASKIISDLRKNERGPERRHDGNGGQRPI